MPAVGIHSTRFVDLTVAKDGTTTVPGSADEVATMPPAPHRGSSAPRSSAPTRRQHDVGSGVFYRLGARRSATPSASGERTGGPQSSPSTASPRLPKDQFPTAAVYGGNFSSSQIRLVTCGGTFDKVKHYLDNVVVFGHLTSVA